MFKKVLVSLFLACIGVSAFALQETPIVQATRVAGTVTGADMYARDFARGAQDVGLVVNSKVTSVTGAVTLTFVVQGKTPQGEYYDVANLTPVAPVAGTPNVLVLRPGITAVAGSRVSDVVPPVFRVRAITTSTGSVTFSIGVGRTN